jgi:chemotaxis protein methyltransferase CheR
MNASERLERLFAERTGIDLGRGLKGAHLHQFVAARAAQLGLGSVDAYVDGLDKSGSQELNQLIDTATVGLTWLFRDPDQLGAIALLFRDLRVGRRLDIWVAACSSGEDAYSVAMLAEAAGREVNVLGTDINSAFLAQAEQGLYSSWTCRSVPPEHLTRLLPRTDGRFQVRDSVRNRVQFGRHNLMDAPPLPASGRGWDLILCRNVLIYFYAQSAGDTVDRLARALAPEGFLVLGANEMLQFGSGLLQIEAIGSRHALRRHDTRRQAPRPVPLPPPAPAPARLAAVQAEPDVQELLTRANQRHTVGQLAEALKLYAQVLAIDPLCAEARMFLGIAHYKTGDALSASVALRAALFLEPELWPAAFYLALSYEQLGSLQQAVLEYRRVVQSAAHPLPGAGEMVSQLEAWKPEVVQLARERSARARVAR